MLIFEEISPLKAQLNKLKEKGIQIGFVPTMGALHDGHFSLIKASQKECDLTVCSIFINPEQFNDSKDFENYPQTLEKDIEQLKALNCDILFAPSVSEMYPDPPQETFNFGLLESTMEGIHRPGHFNGMATVVSRLFNIVEPNKAFFGQKDFQQLVIIKEMVADMNLAIELVSCPIIREGDGLALSSRNVRLTHDERKEAPFIYQSLQKAKELLQTKSPKEAISSILEDYTVKPHLKLEYFEIVDAKTLQPLENLNDENAVICVAAYLGDVRLIDNLLIIS